MTKNTNEQTKTMKWIIIAWKILNTANKTKARVYQMEFDIYFECLQM